MWFVLILTRSFTALYIPWLMYTVLTVYNGMEIKVDAGGIAGKKNAYLGSCCFKSVSGIWKKILNDI